MAPKNLTMIEKINNILLRVSKQQKILFAAALLLIIILFAQTWYINYNKAKQSNDALVITANQTAVSRPSPMQSNLTVISTTPQNEAKNIPAEEKIIITFNRKLEASEVTVTFLPSLTVTIEIDENVLTVTPESPYKPGLKYTYVVRFPNTIILPKSYSFTTTGPTQPFLPDTQPTGAAEKEDNFQRENHPDVFLSNQTPYKGSSFTITSEFKSTPSGHFAFKVSLTGSDKSLAKNEFYNWLTSLQLTGQQITLLDIEYISQ